MNNPDLSTRAHPGADRHRRRRNERGYSLLEVLIVLSIMALVATFVGPRLFSQLDRSKVTAARIQMQSLSGALETMRLDIGRYPTTEEGLSLLTEAPSRSDAGDIDWRGPYVDGPVPSDPWGSEYQYRAPETEDGRPVLTSFGADRKAGGTGGGADIEWPSQRRP